MGRANVYEELDEVYAPEDVRAVGVRRGDQGVVLLKFERRGNLPPAVEVEYIRADGEPSPCVVYSPDLRQVYSYHPDYNVE